MVVGVATTVDDYAHDNEDLFEITERPISEIGN